MRSSASAGLFTAGIGFTSTGAAPAVLRRFDERSSSSLRAALRAVTGSEITDQRNRLESVLSASAVNTCVPSIRSLGAIVTGTSNSGLKLARTYSFESLRLTKTAIWPVGFGSSALATLGRRAASFLTSGATAGISATALAGSAGFSAGLVSTALVSTALGSSTFGASALTGSALLGSGSVLASSVLASSDFASAGLSSAFTPLAESSVLAASSALSPSFSAAPVSTGLLSVAALSVIFAGVASASALTGSDFGASGFASALAAEGVASLIVTGVLAGIELLASAVRVCCAEAWPTVDRSSRLASELIALIEGPASAPLSPLIAGASVFGSSAMTGCGTTFCAISSGCEKFAGVISPGVTITRAPILVQFHILVAKAIGMRMQPCDAG